MHRMTNPKKLKRLYRLAGQQGVRIMDRKGRPLTFRQLIAHQRIRRAERNYKLSYPGHMKALPNELMPRSVQQLVDTRARIHDQFGRGMVSRNSPCPCGTGLRFKRCCMYGLKEGTPR